MTPTVGEAGVGLNGGKEPVGEEAEASLQHQQQHQLLPVPAYPFVIHQPMRKQLQSMHNLSSLYHPSANEKTAAEHSQPFVPLSFISQWENSCWAFTTVRSFIIHQPMRKQFLAIPAQPFLSLSSISQWENSCWAFTTVRPFIIHQPMRKQLLSIHNRSSLYHPSANEKTKPGSYFSGRSGLGSRFNP